MSATETNTAPAPPPKTEAEVRRAEAEVAAAAAMAPRLRFLAELADVEAQAEEELACAAEAGPEVGPASDRDLAAGPAVEERIRAAARHAFGDAWTPDMVGHALQAVVDAEDEADRLDRLYEAIRDRARRREARVRAALWPLILAWCEAHPPAKGKTWKFPTTQSAVVKKNYKDGKLEVAHRGRLAEALKKILGSAYWDVVRVEEEVLVGAAREQLLARGVDPATVNGARWTPPGDRVEVRRG